MAAEHRAAATSQTIQAAALPCLALSVIALGRGLQIADGFYDPTALAWVVSAFAFGLTGALMLGDRPSSASALAVLRAVMVAGIAWQILMLLTSAPGRHIDANANLWLFKSGIAAEAALVALAYLSYSANPRGSHPAILQFCTPAALSVLRRSWFPALLVVHFGLGVWMIGASPSPGIDVVLVHREAIDALLANQDPYRITFQNIYGQSLPFYNPALVVGDRVLFGFPYPPLTLFLAVPGQVIAGDYRYAELAAWVGGAALVGFARRALHARLAAALLLTTPRGFFVLEQGWTEPIGVLMMALTTFCMVRRPSIVPWAGGLLLVTKQYFALAAPLLLRYAVGRRRSATAFVLIAAGVGAAVTLPLALWHPNRFVDAVVLLQTREPFRTDSLSLLSWAARQSWGEGTFVWSIGAGATALLLGLWRTPNTAAGFAAALALSTLSMFLFGSKAFCNYYFLVVAALSCAIAAQQVDDESA